MKLNTFMNRTVRDGKIDSHRAGKVASKVTVQEYSRLLKAAQWVVGRY